MSEFIELHDETPRDLDMELHLLKMARMKAQLKAIADADKRAIRLMREYPRGLPVYRPEDPNFPMVHAGDMM